MIFNVQDILIEAEEKITPSSEIDFNKIHRINGKGPSGPAQIIKRGKNGIPYVNDFEGKPRIVHGEDSKYWYINSSPEEHPEDILPNQEHGISQSKQNLDASEQYKTHQAEIQSKFGSKDDKYDEIMGKVNTANRIANIKGADDEIKGKIETNKQISANNKGFLSTLSSWKNLATQAIKDFDFQKSPIYKWIMANPKWIGAGGALTVAGLIALTFAYKKWKAKKKINKSEIIKKVNAAPPQITNEMVDMLSLLREEESTPQPESNSSPSSTTSATEPPKTETPPPTSAAPNPEQSKTWVSDFDANEYPLQKDSDGNTFYKMKTGIKVFPKNTGDVAVDDHGNPLPEQPKVDMKTKAMVIANRIRKTNFFNSPMGKEFIKRYNGARQIIMKNPSATFGGALIGAIGILGIIQLVRMYKSYRKYRSWKKQTKRNSSFYENNNTPETELNQIMNETFTTFSEIEILGNKMLNCNESQSFIYGKQISDLIYNSISSTKNKVVL